MKNGLSIGSGLRVFLLLGCFLSFRNPPTEQPTLKIGSPAPVFNLPGVDGKNYTLSSFSKARILVVIFTCNHCPTAQSYEDRIMKLTADYSDKGVAVVAIMPNDPKALRLDEMDFSDIGDSFEEMKIRAREKKFNFPYLFDGETQTASKAYGPIATPQVFIFDKDRKLRYNGRFDDTENHDKIPQTNDARNAIEALLNSREITVSVTKVFGCSVKWADKRGSVQDALNKWAKEPVILDTIDEIGLRALLKNESDKLRLINIWAMESNPSLKEWPEFVTINRMYRDRDFEFISIGMGQKDKAGLLLHFLQDKQASNKNYFFDAAGIKKLAEEINAGWNTQLPYTLLLEPGGKIVYSKQGPIDPSEMKKIIVNNHLIGRYP